MSALRPLETTSARGWLVFAGTVKLPVSASLWSHAGRWGGSVTFSAAVAVEPGDIASFEVAGIPARQVEVVAATQHEGGETSVIFRGPADETVEPADTGCAAAVA